MDDKDKLDLEDLEARANDLDEKAADDVTGGFNFRGFRPPKVATPKKGRSRPSKPSGAPKTGGNKGLTGGLKHASARTSGKTDPFGSVLKAHKKLHSKVSGAFKKGR